MDRRRFVTALGTAGVAAHEGEWRLLWQGGSAESGEQAPALDARVVEEVTFDTEENQARVQFGESRLVHRERLQPPSG